MRLSSLKTVAGCISHFKRFSSISICDVVSSPSQSEHIHRARVGMLGLCEDRNSSYLGGAADAPRIIREALKCDSANSWSEVGCDTSEHLSDHGDVIPPSPLHSDVVAALAPVLHKVLDLGQIPFTLGGDHSATYSIFRALASHHAHSGPLVILHLDAHPDLYENFENNLNSHASPFARICEEKLCSKLISVGIRTLNGHQRKQAARYGVEVVEARHCPQSLGETAALLRSLIDPSAQVYISLDLDVLDPAFAPGVSHREPGGLSTRQVLNFVHSCPGRLVGMDLVEYNPSRDLDKVTAATVAKLVKELVGRAVVGPES